LWREVKTYGHYAYAGTEGGGGITIVDLSGLPATYNSKTYTGDGAISGQLGSSHTVQVFGEYLYAFGTSIGTVICSLADPWNPVYVGTYSNFYVHDGTVRNDTLWSSEIFNGQFSIVDITNKANPIVTASYTTPGNFNHNGWFSDDGRYFYTTDEYNNTPLGVFDVSDINNITLVNTYYNDTMPEKEVHNVRVFNDYLINPSYGSQLTIVDGARPLNLIEIARYQTGAFLCWDASPYLPSGNIIATDMDGEFYVFAPYYQRACYLEGTVTNAVSGAPILNANVKIITTTAGDSTDLLGDYYTGYPTAGTFDVEFSAAGYNTKTINGVVLTNGNLTILDVTLDPLVGLEELAVNPIKFAPNPVSDVLHMKIDGYPGGVQAAASVYDQRGVLVYQGKLAPGGSLNLDVSDWSKGIYSMLVSGEKFSLPATRFVKL
jgi:choice-of-anchor B domain-containing protein